MKIQFDTPWDNNPTYEIKIYPNNEFTGYELQLFENDKCVEVQPLGDKLPSPSEHFDMCVQILKKNVRFDSVGVNYER